VNRTRKIKEEKKQGKDTGKRIKPEKRKGREKEKREKGE
jgi:hypothetical protein